MTKANESNTTTSTCGICGTTYTKALGGYGVTAEDMSEASYTTECSCEN